MLADLVVPWSGQLLRHRPKGSRRSVLDDAYLGIAADNRWSAAGVRAYYFASDAGVITAEYARHIGADVPTGKSDRLERSVFRVAVTLGRVLNLTDRAVVAAMGAGPINKWILDVAVTQATADYVLAQVPALEGLVVPSVAFLDRTDQFNVVVYRDMVDPATVFGRPAFAFDITLAAEGR